MESRIMFVFNFGAFSYPGAVAQGNAFLLKETFIETKVENLHIDLYSNKDLESYISGYIYEFVANKRREHKRQHRDVQLLSVSVTRL